ncbi:MAG: hypothetical protein NT030_02735 [Candidatus Saganbacteria bacterium]|nr:hypothetical protein [Candidatus Saganbacteria bacterium]
MTAVKVALNLKQRTCGTGRSPFEQLRMTKGANEIAGTISSIAADRIKIAVRPKYLEILEPNLNFSAAIRILNLRKIRSLAYRTETLGICFIKDKLPELRTTILSSEIYAKWLFAAGITTIEFPEGMKTKDIKNLLDSLCYQSIDGLDELNKNGLISLNFGS